MTHAARAYVPVWSMVVSGTGKVVDGDCLPMPQGGCVTRAQGCGTSATLGRHMGMGLNPNEGCVGRIASGRHIGPMTQPPLGLDGRDGTLTQGSGMAATLGWGTQSRWDRGIARWLLYSAVPGARGRRIEQGEPSRCYVRFSAHASSLRSMRSLWQNPLREAAVAARSFIRAGSPAQNARQCRANHRAQRPPRRSAGFSR